MVAAAAGASPSVHPQPEPWEEFREDGGEREILSRLPRHKQVRFSLRFPEPEGKESRMAMV